MVAKITFHDAAGTVTGSCYRVEHARGTFLVEGGLFQGNKTVRDLDSRSFPFRPGKDIDYLLLPHAHIDHCGLVPKLVANGFRHFPSALHPARLAPCAMAASGPGIGIVARTETTRAIKMPMPKTDSANTWISLAASRSSASGCGIITPQPGPGAWVNPAIMSSFRAGEQNTRTPVCVVRNH